MSMKKSLLWEKMTNVFACRGVQLLSDKIGDVLASEERSDTRRKGKSSDFRLSQSLANTHAASQRRDG
jgi:hypothetical protein